MQPDTQTVPLVASQAWECAPEVSPDGRWLLYESAECGRNLVYVGIPLDDRTVWTGEILPGDEGLILIRRDLEAPGQVIMIRNFLSLVRERLRS